MAQLDTPPLPCHPQTPTDNLEHPPTPRGAAQAIITTPTTTASAVYSAMPASPSNPPASPVTTPSVPHPARRAFPASCPVHQPHAHSLQEAASNIAPFSPPSYRRTYSHELAPSLRSFPLAASGKKKQIAYHEEAHLLLSKLHDARSLCRTKANDDGINGGSQGGNDGSNSTASASSSTDSSPKSLCSNHDGGQGVTGNQALNVCVKSLEERFGEFVADELQTPPVTATQKCRVSRSPEQHQEANGVAAAVVNLEGLMDMWDSWHTQFVGSPEPKRRPTAR